ncbi:unnamed protein product, partial [Polarella glacialis]
YRMCFSTFARLSSCGKVDRTMETRFASSKYDAFRSAFVKAGLLMAVPVIVFSGLAVAKEQWLRLGLLAGFVAPLYLMYALLTVTRKKAYLSFSGTICERLLVALLSAQSVAIVFAEFQRRRPTFGMLSLHVAFVCNFAPLREGDICIITAGFAIPAYLIFSFKRFQE